jgi:hypothetical protein
MQDARAHTRIDGAGGVEAVRMQLKAILRAAGEEMSVSDLVLLFNSDGMHLFDSVHFESAMRRNFGYSGPEDVLKRVFDECDRDKSGRIGYDEIYRFIRGHELGKHRSNASSTLLRKLTLQPKPGTPGAELNIDFSTGKALHYDPHHTWSPEDLRLELQVLLVGLEISPADWFRTVRSLSSDAIAPIRRTR